MRLERTTAPTAPQDRRPPGSPVVAGERPEVTPPAFPLARAELAAFERAHRDGFLVVGRGQGRAARAWFCRCARLDRVFVCVERRGRLSEVVYDAFTLCCDLDEEAYRAVADRFQVDQVPARGPAWGCSPGFGYVHVPHGAAERLARFVAEAARASQRRHRDCGSCLPSWQPRVPAAAASG